MPHDVATKWEANYAGLVDSFSFEVQASDNGFSSCSVLEWTQQLDSIQPLQMGSRILGERDA
jgi:hypothetical protein